MKKGQTSTPFMLIISFLGFLMIISIVYGIQERTGDYVKEQAVEVQSQRVVNAVLALESLDQGYVEVEMDDYKIDLDGYNVTVGYENSNSSSLIDKELVGYDRVERTEFQKVDSKICIQKKTDSGDKVLSISPEAC